MRLEYRLGFNDHLMTIGYYILQFARPVFVTTQKIIEYRICKGDSRIAPSVYVAGVGVRPPRPPNPGGRNPKLRVGPPQDWGVRGASAKLLNLFKTCVYTVACVRGENRSPGLGLRTYG